MAEDDNEKPDKSENSAALSDDDFWESIETEFEDMVLVVRDLRLETEAQSVGKKVGQKIENWELFWEDPEAGARVRPWLQIPWNPERDNEALLEMWERAKALLPFIEEQIKSRALTPEFLSKWGALCKYASLVEAAWFEGRPNTKPLLGGLMHSIQAQKVWYAKVFLQLKKPKEKKGDTEDHVIDHINEILDKNEVPDGRFPPAWYEAILNKDRYNLTRAFRDLGLKEIGRLAEDDTEIIPPTA